jgi:integrase
MPSISFDERVQEYLKKLKEGSRSVAEVAINHFQKFYPEYLRKLCCEDWQTKSTVIDFFRRVYEDSKLPPLDQARVDTNTISDFNVYLIERGYSNKAVRTYVGAIQSLGRYLRIPLSARFTGLPPAVAQTKKHSWELDDVQKFVAHLEAPLHQSLATAFFQAGADISTLRLLEYRDIQEEYETGVVPLCLDLVRHKTQVPHMTFLGEWGAEYLRVWLESRGRLKPHDKLFPISKQGIDNYFLRRALLFAGVKEFPHRNPYAPHTLRAGFNTHCRDHKADPVYVDFWMGHEVPEQQKVYVSKTRDGWRKTYIQMAEAWVTPPAFRRRELQDIAKAWFKAQGLQGDGGS